MGQPPDIEEPVDTQREQHRQGNEPVPGDLVLPEPVLEPAQPAAPTGACFPVMALHGLSPSGARNERRFTGPAIAPHRPEPSIEVLQIYVKMCRRPPFLPRAAAVLLRTGAVRSPTWYVQLARTADARAKPEWEGEGRRSRTGVTRTAGLKPGGVTWVCSVCSD